MLFKELSKSFNPLCQSYSRRGNLPTTLNAARVSGQDNTAPVLSVKFFTTTLPLTPTALANKIPVNSKSSIYTLEYFEQSMMQNTYGICHRELIWDEYIKFCKTIIINESINTNTIRFMLKNVAAGCDNITINYELKEFMKNDKTKKLSDINNFFIKK
jgi:hypothetical protein